MKLVKIWKDNNIYLKTIFILEINVMVCQVSVWKVQFEGLKEREVSYKFHQIYLDSLTLNL